MTGRKLTTHSQKNAAGTVARARHAQKANAGNISGTFLSAPVHPYRSLYTLLFRVRTRRAFIRHACTRVQSTVAICICERCMLMTFEEPRLPAAPPPFWIIPGLHRVCLIAARVQPCTDSSQLFFRRSFYAEEFFFNDPESVKLNWKIDLSSQDLHTFFLNEILRIESKYTPNIDI